MNLKVVIFDVEHGFCAFVRSPTGHGLLIDCGRSSSFSPVDHLLASEMADCCGHNGHGLTKLVISHPHDDHVEGIADVTAKLAPAILLRQKYNWDSLKTDSTTNYPNLDVYAQWQETYSCPVTSQPDWGMELLCGPYLSPQEARDLSGDATNNSSIVVFVGYAGHKFAFMGDLMTAGWEALLANATFQKRLAGTTVFVAPHHGHSSGYTPDIYRSMGRPAINIVSAHSGDESVESAYSTADTALGVEHNGRQRYMLSTRHDGTITFEVDSSGNARFWTDHLPPNSVDFWRAILSP